MVQIRGNDGWITHPAIIQNEHDAMGRERRCIRDNETRVPEEGGKGGQFRHPGTKATSTWLSTQKQHAIYTSCNFSNRRANYYPDNWRSLYVSVISKLAVNIEIISSLCHSTYPRLNRHVHSTWLKFNKFARDIYYNLIFRIRSSPQPQ